MRAINKTIKKMQERVNVIDNKNIKIATGIVFTSATDFYYTFTIYKHNNIFKTYNIYNDNEYANTFNTLKNKYNLYIWYDYSNLTNEQLRYLTTAERGATEPKDRPIINMLEAMLTELNLNTPIQKRPTLKLEG